MNKYKVPIQSMIDHIKSATDVDPWAKDMAEDLLKEQEDRHRLEVHNIGNVDIPEGVSEEHFHLVMNNVVDALQHTDKGESYPYEDTGR